MGEQTVPVLLITANVGSVFENVSFCARFISFLIENSFPSEMGKMSLHVGNQVPTGFVNGLLTFSGGEHDRSQASPLRFFLLPYFIRR